MKPIVVIFAGLLFVSCTSSTAPRSVQPTNPFQSAWDKAEDWAAAQERFSAATTGVRGEATATMLFWPEHSGRQGLSLSARREFAEVWESASSEVAKGTLLAKIQKQREADTLGRTYRLVLPVAAAPEGDAWVFGQQACTQTGCIWVLPPLAHAVDQNDGKTDWQVLTGNDRTFLRLTTAKVTALATVRCVFRLQSEPVVATAYRHGDEVTVGTWGCGLEPIAIELLGSDGAALDRLFIRSR